jgi:hypothetical protein
MNIRQLRDLAIKFIGLYCLTSGVLTIPSIVSLLAYAFGPGFHFGQFLIALLYLAMLPFYFGFAYLLLLQTPGVAAVLWPEEELSTGPDFDISLETCVALIGLYYIPNVLHGIMLNLACAARPEGMSGRGYTDILPDAVMLTAAVLCIVKSKAIATHIRKYTE